MSAEPSAAALARYVRNLRFDRLPTAVRDWTTALVEDHLGCVLGGLALPDAASVLAVAETSSGPTSALVIGRGRAAVSSAVFCNSQLANLLDFDDSYDSTAPLHPGSMVIPAALAVAQATTASGQAFLTAVAAGYEVAMRVGRAVGNRLWNPGAPCSGVGELGAAIAAAKLYELDEDQIRALFSIVDLDLAGVARQPRVRAPSDLPASYRLGTLKGNFGTLAQTGLWAARKARAGLTEPPGLLEHDFSHWYRSGLPAAGFEQLTAGLGTEYVLTRISLKPTPSCRWTHPPITAAWNALSGIHVAPADVTRIGVFGVPRLDRPHWETVMDAQYSIPCALALAVRGVEPGPRWYVEGEHLSSATRELAAKVVQTSDPAIEYAEMRGERITCRVEIDLTDGRTLSGTSWPTKGSVDNPLTAAERRAKFVANTAHLGGQGLDVRAAIHNIAEASTMDELTLAMSAATPTTLPNR